MEIVEQETEGILASFSAKQEVKPFAESGELKASGGFQGLRKVKEV